MTRDFKIFTSFLFLMGLALLLLNDFFFKELFSNWLTGKLSDFAGLFIFPLFWSALMPRHKNKIFLITGLLFVFWKSSFSQTFIDTWNGFGLLPVSRVVDLTDLIALAVLPLAYLTEKHKDKLTLVPIQPIIPIVLAAFSFLATSYSTEIEINKTYEFNFSKETLKNRLAGIDSLNYGNGVDFGNSNPDTIEIIIPYDLCFNNFDAKIIIEEISTEKTLMTLVNAFHNCPEGKNDKKEATEAFEKIIIDRIRNAK